MFYFRVFMHIDAHDETLSKTFYFIIGYPPYNVLWFQRNFELKTVPLNFRGEKFERNQLEYSYTGRDQFLLKWLRVMNVPSLKGPFKGLR